MDVNVGVRPIKDINVALLSMCLWRLGIDGEFPWKTVLIQKYKVGNQGREANPFPSRASGMWREIVAE